MIVHSETSLRPEMQGPLNADLAGALMYRPSDGASEAHLNPISRAAGLSPMPNPEDALTNSTVPVAAPFALVNNGPKLEQFEMESLSKHPELAAVYDRYLSEAKFERHSEGVKIYVATSFHVSRLMLLEGALQQYFGQQIASVEARRFKDSPEANSRTSPARLLQTSLPLPQSQRNLSATIQAAAQQTSLSPIEIERKRRHPFPDLISSMAFETPIALTRRWCEGVKMGARGQVLWVHGKPGSGKTAILKQLHGWIPLELRLEFVDVMKFFHEWRRALEAKDTLSFIRKYRKETQIFVLENIDELETKEKTQQEVLFTINAILDAGGSIAVSSCKHPVQLKETLEASLYSRLFSGMILEMPAPDRGFKETLWRKLLDSYGLGDCSLEISATEHLLSLEVDTIRKAHTLFINAVGRLSLNKNLSTADLQELQFLHAAASPSYAPNQAPSETLEKVAKLCGVTRAAIAGKVRRCDISQARRFVCLALARFNGLTNASIAILIEKDPSTVSHALKTLEEDIETLRSVREQWNWICSQLGMTASAVKTP